jgi:hypothetical protein
MIVFTRGTNRVDVNIDSGTKRMSLDPNLQITGIVGESVIYFSVGPLDDQRERSVLTFPVLAISGRPNDNPFDIADWLAINYFFGNDYTGGGGGGGDASAANQVTQIALAGDIDASVQELVAKTKGSDMMTIHDAREFVRFVGGSLNGKISYILYLTGGRFGVEAARKTLYYDGNDKLQYTEVT